MTASDTDQQLVQRAQRGDLRAFDLLVLKYQGRIAALVSRYVSDAGEVEDVTQEAFIKAYRALGKFRGDSAFYTWLYRIAANAAKNHLVAKGRRPGAMRPLKTPRALMRAECSRKVPLRRRWRWAASWRR